MTNGSNSAGVGPTRSLLWDSFGRVRELVEAVLADADEPMLTFRPDPDANSIGWLVWHLTRIQDDHVQALAGAPQVWTAQGWSERFELPFDDNDTGYGHTSEQVAAVTVRADALDQYHRAVHDACLAYVDGLTAPELERVVDTRWDPPVTASARLVSVLGDCLQHVGQAAYVRGLHERAG